MAFLIHRTEVTPVAYFKRADFVGELAFFDKSPRSASLVCLEETILKKYQNDVRPSLLIGTDDYTLFLNQYGEQMSMDALSRRVRVYMKAAKIDKAGSCHLFRHSMATHMLENGADIRFIQALLGHAKLDTTQIYTQVSIKKLKAIHEATHTAISKGSEPLEID